MPQIQETTLIKVKTLSPKMLKQTPRLAPSAMCHVESVLGLTLASEADRFSERWAIVRATSGNIFRICYADFRAHKQSADNLSWSEAERYMQDLPQIFVA